MTRLTGVLLTATLLAFSPLARAQQPEPTSQALISIDSKNPVTVKPSDVLIKVDDKKTELTALLPVPSARVGIALLIDDGLRESVGRELDDIRHFILAMPPGTAILIGYMQNGDVTVVKNFTTEHQDAANAVRVPLGSRGISASPYFCISEFVKRWPPVPGQAHIILTITDGVDPYNGSVSPMNQNSPYVDAAVRDAQRAGVPVYSMYFTDAGIRGGLASFSGQSYLALLAEGTGARAFYQGTGNPVSMAPFLAEFQKAVNETYLAVFPAPIGKEKDLFRFKASTKLPKTKIYAPELVPPPTLGEPAS